VLERICPPAAGDCHDLGSGLEIRAPNTGRGRTNSQPLPEGEGSSLSPFPGRRRIPRQRGKASEGISNDGDANDPIKPVLR
jgi:hypothetical protein